MNNFKRILSITLLISVLFCSNGFSAVVNDNDPDAFITKAEFEAMISSVNDKMSTYFSTIDNTIDSAISTYLSGVAGESIDNGNKIKY